MPTQPKNRPVGRPRLPADQRQVKVSARLYPPEIERLTARYGSVHAAIRRLVEAELSK